MHDGYARYQGTCMESSRGKKTVSKTILSALITSLLLGGVSIFFIRWIVPTYSIDSSLMYSILIRLFPILIGLILMLIGIILAFPTDTETTDRNDALAPSESINPLDTVVDQDIPNKPLPTQTLFEKAGEHTSKAQNTYEDIIPFKPVSEPLRKPVSVPASTFQTTPRDKVAKPALAPTMPIEPLPVSVAEPEALALPVEKTVAPVIDETDHPSITPSSVKADKNLAILTQAVTFYDYPYQIDPDSDFAELLVPLPETLPMSDPRLVPHQQILENTFGNRLDSEIFSARQNGYDVSVAIFSVPNLPGDLEATTHDKLTKEILVKLGFISFFYVLGDHRIASILPFYRYSLAKNFLARLLESLRKTYPESSVNIGFSSLRNRMEVDKAQLFREAELAIQLAEEQGGYSLIGYDNDSNPKT